MPKRPNILFITCDQLRKDALGCYGNPVIRTPHIDSIAESGCRFESMFVVSPACAPSRASIATGRYPSVHGLKLNGVCLPESEITMMETFRKAGYRTYGTGKMHFHPQWGYQFDELDSMVNDVDTSKAINPQPLPWDLPFYGIESCALTEDHNAGPYGDYLCKHGLDPWKDAHSFTYPQHLCTRSSVPAEHSKTTWITDRSIEFLDKHPEEDPFFMWVSYVHPHHPFVVPAPYDTMYPPEDMPLPRQKPGEEADWPESYRAKFERTSGSHEAIGMNKLEEDDWRRIKSHYYGMISHIDDQIGRILADLELKGLRENTIIVFSADHGELLGDHRMLFKIAYFDEVMNVPFILQHPDGGSGTACQSLLSSLEIAPTLLLLCGIDIPAGMQASGFGEDLMAHRSIESRPSVFMETPDGDKSIRTERARLTWHGSGKRGELYDLTRDPHCFENLWEAAEASNLKADMMELLVNAMAESVDPLPLRVTIC